MKSGFLFLFPEVEDPDVAIIIQREGDKPLEECKPSMWRRVSTLECGHVADVCPLSLQYVNCFEIWDKEGCNDEAPPENVMSQLARQRWKLHSQKLQKRQDNSKQMLDARYRRATQNKVDVSVQVEYCSILFSGNAQTTFAITSSYPETDPKITLGVHFLLECVRNLQMKAPRYDEKMYDISSILYLSSPKTYRLLRQMFCLPATSSLHRKYGQQTKKLKNELLNISNLQETLTSLKTEITNLRNTGLQVNPKFTLAIDAFCFRSFAGPSLNLPKERREKNVLDNEEGLMIVQQDQLQFNHGFVFLLIAHDYRLPVKIVHLAANKGGAYNKGIDEKAEAIRKVANELELRIWFRATDGDPGMNAAHDTFYAKFLQGRGANFGSLVTYLHAQLSQDRNLWIPITDPLHALKNMRARLIKHSLQLFPSCPHTSIEEIRRVLALGPVLDDESQIGKMRDCYVVGLFTFRNVSELLKEGQYVAACFLLPFACWMGAIFSVDMDLSFRLFCVELSFQLIRIYFGEFEQLKAEKVPVKATGDSCITFATTQAATRMLNTLASFGVALSFSDENIRMDSLGTHLVENMIGIARATSSDPRFERIVETYTTAERRKRLAAKLGLTIHIPGRVNHGGCKVDPDHQCAGRRLVSKPWDWKVDDLVQLCVYMCNPDVVEAISDDVAGFIAELDSVAQAVDRRVYSVNEAANSGIMARLIQFRH